MIKTFFLKDHPMPMPEMSYPSFWLYLEDYKEEFVGRVLKWLKYKEIPLIGPQSKNQLIGHFSDLKSELGDCFKETLPTELLTEVEALLKRALLLIYYGGDNPQVYSDKENLLLRAKEIISAVIDEHVENKSYSQGEDDEYPKIKL